MIGWIKGKLVVRFEINKKYRVIINVNGIGHIINMRADDYIIAPNVDHEFFTKNIISEKSNELYGFKEFLDVMMFTDLISVDRIGPSAAMKIMSAMNNEAIIKNIVESNMKPFLDINGIGKSAIENINKKLQEKYSLEK